MPLREVLTNTSLDCTPNFFYTQYMLTLSQASKETKEIIKWLGIIAAGFILLLIFIRITFYVKDLIFPQPPEKPTVVFGKLQGQVFPQTVTAQSLTYTINTLTGTLPLIKTPVKVYRMQPPRPDLLVLNKFNQQAMQAGFNSGYTQVSDKVFEWKSNLNLSNLDRRLRVNIVSYGFTITSPYMTDSAVLSAKDLPTEDKAIITAVTMLTNMQTLPEDIDLLKTKTNLFAIQNGNLVPSTSLSNSHVIEVGFLQKDVNELPIYYENPNSSNISILVGGGGYQGQIVAASFIHQAISDEASTYPIKTAGQAYEELKEGKGYVAAYFGTSSNISITDVFLAYYIGSQPQDFLMPVMVFKGGEGFFAYVPAVTDEWINN